MKHSTISEKLQIFLLLNWWIYFSADFSKLNIFLKGILKVITQWKCVGPVHILDNHEENNVRKKKLNEIFYPAFFWATKFYFQILNYNRTTLILLHFLRSRTITLCFIAEFTYILWNLFSQIEYLSKRYFKSDNAMKIHWIHPYSRHSWQRQWHTKKWK